jgi:hypothetical protein
MTDRLKYSDHLEALVALVTNLAMANYISRTPSGLAKSIGFPQDEVVFVLENFNGLFRRGKLSKKNEHFFMLQLRYARKWLEKPQVRATAPTADESEDAEEPPREPLNADYLNTLLTYVMNRATQEYDQAKLKMTLDRTLITSLVAAFAAITAALMAVLWHVSR